MRFISIGIKPPNGFRRRKCTWLDTPENYEKLIISRGHLDINIFPKYKLAI
jgi:hypothetical protein